MKQKATKTDAKTAVRSAVYVALRRSFYVLLVVGLWLLMYRTELAHPRYLDTGTVILGALLFLLALPTSIVFRLDKLSEVVPLESYTATLLFGVLIVALNWVIIAAIRALVWRGQDSTKRPADSD